MDNQQTLILFVKSEVENNFTCPKKLANWLALSQKNRDIIRIRNNLYSLIDPITKSAAANRFQIASKITPTAFVAYHSALEYYGLSNQVFGEVTVGSLTQFNNFQFEGVDYNCQKEKNNAFVLNNAGEHVRVTSLERTIVDCIDKISLSGGIEEVISALNQIKVVNTTDLLKILADRNEIFLYQKVGFLLEFFRESMSLPDSFFKECQQKTTRKTRYFLNDDFKDVAFNKKWKLIAPLDPLSRIYGGIK